MTNSDDSGSVTPLVLGMALILLVLSMGIGAATDVWLTRNRLLNRCEGAALAASFAADLPTGSRRVSEANTAAIRYLAERTTTTGVTVDIDAALVRATCWSEEPVLFGWLFGSDELRQTVSASARLEMN
jgi:hypothetical protein